MNIGKISSPRPGYFWQPAAEDGVKAKTKSQCGLMFLWEATICAGLVDF